MHPVHKRVVLLNMPAVAGVDPDAATAVNDAAVWITARLAVLLLVLICCQVSAASTLHALHQSCCLSHLHKAHAAVASNRQTVVVAEPAAATGHQLHQCRAAEQSTCAC
jgi:hypothetical protein